MHHTLQEVGVSLTTLFPIYDRMFKAKVTMLTSCKLSVRVGGGGGGGGGGASSIDSTTTGPISRVSSGVSFPCVLGGSVLSRLASCMHM